MIKIGCFCTLICNNSNIPKSVIFWGIKLVYFSTLNKFFYRENLKKNIAIRINSFFGLLAWYILSARGEYDSTTIFSEFLFKTPSSQRIVVDPNDRR